MIENNAEIYNAIAVNYAENVVLALGSKPTIFRTVKLDLACYIPFKRVRLASWTANENHWIGLKTDAS